MTPNLPVLPDSIGYLLLILGVIAVVVVCIKETIDDIKADRRESSVRKLEAAVKADKVSHQLADYYLAAAYGDEKDFSYWYETARKFM